MEANLTFNLLIDLNNLLTLTSYLLFYQLWILFLHIPNDIAKANVAIRQIDQNNVTKSQVLLVTKKYVKCGQVEHKLFYC